MVPVGMSLSKIQNFSDFYKTAQKVRSRSFLVYYRLISPTQPQTEQRLGWKLAVAMVGSKKGVDKRAVRRNRAKRRLRSSFAHIMREWSEPVCAAAIEMEIVFMANRNVLSCSWEHLVNEMRSCLWERYREARGAR